MARHEHFGDGCQRRGKNMYILSREMRILSSFLSLIFHVVFPRIQSSETILLALQVSYLGPDLMGLAVFFLSAFFFAFGLSLFLTFHFWSSPLSTIRIKIFHRSPFLILASVELFLFSWAPKIKPLTPLIKITFNPQTPQKTHKPLKKPHSTPPYTTTYTHTPTPLKLYNNKYIYIYIL